MKIRQKVPVDREIEHSSITQTPRRLLKPFAPLLVDFCAALSQALLTDAQSRQYAELQALGFWMRKSQIFQLKADFEKLKTAESEFVPRGLVFHLPPANVDTMFVYSWLFSHLTGNASLIRLSSRQSPLTDILCRLFNKTLGEKRFRALAPALTIVSYGHEEEPTAAFSKLADLRVIWGGDEAVTRIRAFPLKPRARDLTFPDRYSFCVMDARRFLKLTDSAAKTAIQAFYNDAYWYDQLACSSPRLLVWRANPSDAAKAGERLFNGLNALLKIRGPRFETGAVLKKLSFAHEVVIDAPVAGYKAFSNELSVLPLKNLNDFHREHCGAGLFFQSSIANLKELSSLIRDQDQTMTYFGLTPAELRSLVVSLNGQGLSRVVPLGQALTFNRFWDGYDLLREMTQQIFIQK